MRSIELTAGRVEYEDTGGDGPVLVLVGGLAIGPSLWEDVVERLRADHRCVVPTLPWGAHRIPMRADADLSLRGHARILAELLERLDLPDPTLVENDTAMAQLLAADRPDLPARLVLVSCEAFDNYPPGLPGRTLARVARLPGGVNLAMQQLRLRPLRRLPMTYGRMTSRPIPHARLDEWLRPLQTRREIRRDLTAYLRSTDRRILLETAPRLVAFDRPGLVVWGAEDRVMPIEHGRRLAAILPRGRFVEVPGSGTLVPLDQPALLAEILRAFVRDAPAPAAGATGV